MTASARATLVEAADEAVRTALRALGDPDGSKFAVIATGGYGRGWLAPLSDLDLLLVPGASVTTERAGQVAMAFVSGLRAGGWRVDHAVRSVGRTESVLNEAPWSVVSVSSSRVVVGDEAVAGEIRGLAASRLSDADWPGHAALTEDRERRHRRFGSLGEVAEPHLKDAVGGVRDAGIGAAVAAARGDLPGAAAIVESVSGLLDVRDALHETAGWRTDRLTLARRPVVAEHMGVSEADIAALLRP